jgi:hypothetical protein
VSPDITGMTAVSIDRTCTLRLIADAAYIYVYQAPGPELGSRDPSDPILPIGRFDGPHRYDEWSYSRDSRIPSQRNCRFGVRLTQPDSRQMLNQQAMRCGRGVHDRKKSWCHAGRSL